MNVFLPYSDYTKSVRVLDNQRLNKQILESSQILKVLKFGGKWENHPATRMFRKTPGALVRYTLAACDEAEARGIKVSKRNEISSYGVSDEIPEWSDCEAIYAGYRSNLLRKGRADAVCKRIKQYFKFKSINTWLKECDFPEKTFLTLDNIKSLERFASDWEIPIVANFYQQYGWGEADSLPYVWPVN